MSRIWRKLVMGNQPVCYIFGAGEYYNPPLVQPNPCDLVIAADGGYLYTQKFKIVADIVLGDFDSLSKPPKEDIKTIILPREKDDTDMLAAIREGWQRGFRTFHLYGGTGGRLDHTMANIQCIAYLAYHGGRGYLFDRNFTITAIHNDSIVFPASLKGMVSVFSHSGMATGVSIKGLKYTLDNGKLDNTYPIGISNEFVGVVSSISVENGTLVIMYSNDIVEI